MQRTLETLGYFAIFALVLALVNFLGCSPLKETCWGRIYLNPYFKGY